MPGNPGRLPVPVSPAEPGAAPAVLAAEAGSRAVAGSTFIGRDLVGNETAVQLQRPGGELRVSVGRAGEQSGIWKITASANVVVTTRGIAKDAKITLHREGDWWLAFHRKSRAQELTGKFGRTVVSLKPPAPNAAGWIHALSVSVPHGELSRPYGDDDTSGGITWLDPAASGHEVGIHLVVAKPNQARGRSDGVFVGGFTLNDGRLLLIYRTHQRLLPETHSRIEQKRAETGVLNNPGGPETRCLIGEWSDYRPLYLWDLASAPAQA
jgi:hypothetical protein